MASEFQASALGLFSRALPNPVQEWLVRLLCRPLVPQLCGAVTDKFLELLLGSMALAFRLSREYRRNIEGFRATYVYATRDGSVASSAIFDGGKMSVEPEARPSGQVRITFRDYDALRAFLLSDEPDSLDSILANNVEVEGNLNYVYRMGFLARDLSRRLGVLQP